MSYNDIVDESSMEKAIKGLDQFENVTRIKNQYEQIQNNPILKKMLVEECIKLVYSDSQHLTLLENLICRDITLVEVFLVICPTSEELVKRLRLREYAHSSVHLTVQKVERIVSILENEKAYYGVPDLVYFI